MTKKFFLRLLILMLTACVAFPLFGCAKTPEDEKAGKALLKVVDQLLAEKITAEKAQEKIEGISIPENTALGYALSKHRQNILALLAIKDTEEIKNTRKILADFDQYKAADPYYKAFQTELKNRDGLRDYKAFMDEINRCLAGLTDYEMKQIDKTELDLGRTVYTYTIDCTKFDDSFSLKIEADKNGKITLARLSRKLSSFTTGNFPAFCTYVYRCMGLEIENSDFDAFYQKFDLRSQEKINKTHTEGDYQVSCMTVDLINEIVFSISEK